MNDQHPAFLERRKAERRGAFDPATQKPVMREATNRRRPEGAALSTAESIRREAIEECWNAVNALIRHGELPYDQHEQRNGLVLATNAIRILEAHPAAPGKET